MYFYDWIAGEEFGFVGTCKIKIPKNQERMRFIKSMNISAVENKETGKLEGKSEDPMKSVEVLLDFAASHIEKVDLKRKGDDMIFDKVEMLEYDVKGQEVLSAIGNKLMFGVELGKK